MFIMLVMLIMFAKIVRLFRLRKFDFYGSRVSQDRFEVYFQVSKCHYESSLKRPLHFQFVTSFEFCLSS
jgi:hypothetical protein